MIHPHRLGVIVALLALLTVGCKEAAQKRDVPPDPSTPATSPILNESAFSMILRVPSEVALGEPVPLTMIVRNISQQPAYLETGDSTTTFDVWITDRFGKTVWRRMHERESLAALHELTLAPGEEVRFTDTWDQRSNSGGRVPQGKYEVHGTLDAQGDRNLVTAPAQLVILAQH